MCKAGEVCPVYPPCDTPLRGSITKGSKSLPMTNPFDVLYGKNFDIVEGRTIYLSRHGESEYNVEDRIGGNSSITERGHQYARALGTYMNATGKNTQSIVNQFSKVFVVTNYILLRNYGYL